jgi:hypothetical protein
MERYLLTNKFVNRLQYRFGSFNVEGILSLQLIKRLCKLRSSVKIQQENLLGRRI